MCRIIGYTGHPNTNGNTKVGEKATNIEKKSEKLSRVQRKITVP